MVRLVRAEKMVLSGLVFARKIARMILIQNIQGLMGPLMINMAFMYLSLVPFRPPKFWVRIEYIFQNRPRKYLKSKNLK